MGGGDSKVRGLVEALGRSSAFDDAMAVAAPALKDRLKADLPVYGVESTAEVFMRIREELRRDFVAGRHADVDAVLWRLFGAPKMVTK